MSNPTDKPNPISAEEAAQIIRDEVLGAWGQFCAENVGSTDSRVGDVLAAAVNRATAKVFER